MAWIAVGDYEITARDGSVVCRRPTGRELKSVPKAVRDAPETLRLRDALDWLVRHDATCVASVDTWMTRSLPVPTGLVVQVWADEAWRGALRDLVVAVGDVRHGLDAERQGLLRDVTGAGVRLVTLDGDTLTVDDAVLTVPHPVLLDDLPDWREFAADLEVAQKVDQLFRQTYAVPADLEPGRTEYRGYAGGEFAELRFAVARASSLGYAVRAGSAVCRVLERGVPVEARFWIGDYDPWSSTETGGLSFVGPEGRALPLTDVGAVAWSEGLRMAAAVHAGRTTTPQEDAR